MNCPICGKVLIRKDSRETTYVMYVCDKQHAGCGVYSLMYIMKIPEYKMYELEKGASAVFSFSRNETIISEGDKIIHCEGREISYKEMFRILKLKAFL